MFDKYLKTNELDSDVIDILKKGQALLDKKETSKLIKLNNDKVKALRDGLDAVDDLDFYSILFYASCYFEYNALHSNMYSPNTYCTFFNNCIEENELFEDEYGEVQVEAMQGILNNLLLSQDRIGLNYSKLTDDSYHQLLIEAINTITNAINDDNCDEFFVNRYYDTVSNNLMESLNNLALLIKNGLREYKRQYYSLSIDSDDDRKLIEKIDLLDDNEIKDIKYHPGTYAMNQYVLNISKMYSLLYEFIHYLDEYAHLNLLQILSITDSSLLNTFDNLVEVKELLESEHKKAYGYCYKPGLAKNAEGVIEECFVINESYNKSELTDLHDPSLFYKLSNYDLDFLDKLYALKEIMNDYHSYLGKSKEVCTKNASLFLKEHLANMKSLLLDKSDELSSLANDYSDKINDLDSKVSTINSEINELAEKASKTKGLFASKKIAKIEEQINELSLEIDKINQTKADETLEYNKNKLELTKVSDNYGTYEDVSLAEVKLEYINELKNGKDYFPNLSMDLISDLVLYDECIRAKKDYVIDKYQYVKPVKKVNNLITLSNNINTSNLEIFGSDKAETYFTLLTLILGDTVIKDHANLMNDKNGALYLFVSEILKGSPFSEKIINYYINKEIFNSNDFINQDKVSTTYNSLSPENRVEFKNNIVKLVFTTLSLIDLEPEDINDISVKLENTFFKYIK